MIKDKKAFLKWLRDEQAILTSDNLISAEKAFFAHSVFTWCTKETKKGTMSPKQIENCLYTLRRFLKGKLDLCWDSGIIKVIKTEPKEGANNASNSMADRD